VSVHSEYSRALESFLDRLRGLTPAESAPWIAALEASRIGAHPNLSSAARACLDVLESIQRDARAMQASGLRDPQDILEAHCRIILGE
jgi:hypothetical protein